MKTLDKGFKPFTLLHKEKDQFCRFEPTDDPETVYVRFKGACGHVMENLVRVDLAVDQIAHLYSLGYVEAEEPEGFEQRFLHEL